MFVCGETATKQKVGSHQQVQGKQTQQPRALNLQLLCMASGSSSPSKSLCPGLLIPGRTLEDKVTKKWLT